MQTVLGRITRGNLLLIHVLVLSLVVACKTPDLVKITSGVDKAAAAARLAEGDLDKAAATGLISVEQVTAVRPVLLKLITNMDLTSEALHKIKDLTPENRKNVLNLLEPISDALNAADLSAIKNAETRKKIEMSFVALRAGLETARIVLRE